jgi:hypothetical protein
LKAHVRDDALHLAVAIGGRAKKYARPLPATRILSS